MQFTLIKRQPSSVLATLLSFVAVLQLTQTQKASPIPAILKFIRDNNEQLKNEPSDQKDLLEEYDFIVVGAGTAGCALANRLTEVPDWKVLLVEAGGHETFAMDIPLVVNYLQFTPANWNYKTKPSDRYGLGFKNNQVKWPRGKVMGGSSVLNYMIYTRGSQKDYDNWRDLGNDGWGWDDVLPYMKKVENFNIPSFNDSDYHGYGGYLNVEFSPFRTEMSKAWVEAATEMGFKYGDYNGENPSGVSFLQLSMKNGTRHSSSRAYLHPINERKNLYVSKHSLVTNLIFDDSKTKVIGIELEKNNKKRTVMASKEVIVSAGAINSPQLLMLSGIGPRSHLEDLEIPVVKDLPVGYNLMDHVAIGGLQFEVKPQNITLSTYYVLSHPDTLFQWMKTHNGPLAVPGGCEAIAYMELKDKFNETGWPDIELLFIGGGLKSDPTLRYNYNFDDKIFDETFGDLGTSDVFMVYPILMRPKSKGKVLLKNKNPKEHPILIPHYYQYDDDLKKIVEGLKIAIEITKQPSMKNLNAKLYDVPIKKCLKYGSFGSDEYFECQAKMFSVTNFHQSGTCKMGPEDDETSVVDSRLRVHGIGNLRVMDTSIMPEIVSTHTNAPAFMIAEKGADMIKQDWGKL